MRFLFRLLFKALAAAAFTGGPYLAWRWLRQSAPGMSNDQWPPVANKK